jgi:hypothetical protein
MLGSRKLAERLTAREGQDLPRSTSKLHADIFYERIEPIFLTALRKAPINISHQFKPVCVWFCSMWRSAHLGALITVAVGRSPNWREPMYGYSLRADQLDRRRIRRRSR